MSGVVYSLIDLQAISSRGPGSSEGRRKPASPCGAPAGPLPGSPKPGEEGCREPHGQHLPHAGGLAGTHFVSSAVLLSLCVICSHINPSLICAQALPDTSMMSKYLK